MDDPVIERCRSGIPTLDDDILSGGLPRGTMILLTGSSGVGKTTLACQFLFNGATKFNENGLVFTLTESVTQMKRFMSQFAFYSTSAVEEKKVQFLDMRTIYKQMGMERDQYTVSDMNSLLRIIDEVITNYNIKRLVVDSITAMIFRMPDKEKIRDFLYRLGNIIFDHNVVALLTAEEQSGTRFYTEQGIEFICDGIIFLKERELGNTLLRTLQVVKMRGMAHDRGEHEMILTSNGIELTERTF